MGQIGEPAQQEQEESTDKVAGEFKKTVGTLIALLGSDKPLKPSKKIAVTELDILVQGLLKEEKEANAKEVSEQLKALLKGYTDLRREVSQKKKELEQLEQVKMKDFNKAAKALFDKVDGINEKAKEYYAGLAEATKSQENK